MPYAVQLYFDAAAERDLRDLRAHLILPGEVVSVEDRPHISLAVIDELDEQRVTSPLQEFAANLAGFPVRLASVGSFPTQENVLFLSPVPSVGLLEVHADFHRLLREMGVKASEYYLPGVWVPHSTVLLGLPEERFAQTFESCRQSFRPVAGRFVELGLIRFAPVEPVCSFPLA
jgi:2'-5' RNA ligase